MRKSAQWLAAIIFFVLLPSHVFGVAINDGTVATATLNVRATPSTSGTVLYTVPATTVGLIVSGPTVANGYTWWYMSWANNPLVNGWSADANFTVQAANPSVFTDYLFPGWHILPWTNTTVANTTATHAYGTTSIQASASAAYGRLYIQTTAGFNTGSPSTQQSLHLSLMNPTAANGQQLYVGLYTPGGTVIHYVPAFSYVTGGALNANQWYDLVIPIADLQAGNQAIGGVVIETEVAATFYADQINFSTTYGSTYWTPPPPSTITSVSASCSPSSIYTGQASQCSASVQGTGSYNSAVTWSTNGGSINSSGYFTAPGSPTTATVTATSVQDTTKSGSTTIVVSNPPPPPPTQASDAIFTDSMWSGWYIGSWTQVTVDPTSDTLYRGTYGMQVQVATPAYGRVQLKTYSGYVFNTTGYDSVSFVLNIGTFENESLYVGLLDVNGYVIQYVPLANYTPTHTLDNSYAYQWQPIRIPLADLGAANANVYGIEIQSVAPATFFLDDVMFQPTGGCNGK